MEIKAFLEHQEEDSQNVASVKELYNSVLPAIIFKVLTGESTDISSNLLVENPTWNVCPGFPDGGIYCGMAEVFGKLYANLLKRYHYFNGEPEVFIDGGNVVTVLGHYIVVIKKGEPAIRVRFSHTWKIAPDGRIEGVWQVADSAVLWEGLNNLD